MLTRPDCRVAHCLALNIYVPTILQGMLLIALPVLVTKKHRCTLAIPSFLHLHEVLLLIKGTSTKSCRLCAIGNLDGHSDIFCLWCAGFANSGTQPAKPAHHRQRMPLCPLGSPLTSSATQVCSTFSCHHVQDYCLAAVYKVWCLTA